MRFIRKNGRVIPIREDRGGSPSRIAATGAATFVGGNVLARKGARKFIASVHQANTAKSFKAAPNALMKAGHTVDYWAAIHRARKGVAMIAAGTVAGAVGAGLLARAGILALRKKKSRGKGQ